MTFPARPGTDPTDATIAHWGFKAFGPKRPGLQQADVDRMRKAHNPADDTAPGDPDHTEFADLADELDISHVPPWRYP